MNPVSSPSSSINSNLPLYPLVPREPGTNNMPVASEALSKYETVCVGLEFAGVQSEFIGSISTVPPANKPTFKHRGDPKFWTSTK